MWLSAIKLAVQAGSKIKEMKQNLVNKNKIYVRFGCVKKNVEEEDA